MWKKNKWALIVIWIISVGVLPTHRVNARAANEPQLFKEYGYGDRTVMGMYGSLEYFFPVPENWALDEKTNLNLIISHSPLLLSPPSTMTVIANDVAVHSSFLDASNANHSAIQIELPVLGFGNDLPRAEGYSIRIRFFMRLTDEICEESANAALWATIHQSSTLTLAAQERETGNDLRFLPYPLVKRNVMQSEGELDIILPESSTNEQIAAAGMVAAYLGRQSGDSELILNSVSGSAESSNTQLWITDSPQGFDIGDSDAFLAMKEVNGTSAVFLGGEQPLLAAKFLTYHDDFALSGDYVEIRREQDPSMTKDHWAWRDSSVATFSQLGGFDRTIRGVGQQSAFYFFQRPTEWEVDSEGAFLALHLTPSSLLLAEQSGILVKINGVGVGTISFQNEPDENGFYSLELDSATLNRVGEDIYQNELLIEFVVDQQIQQAECEPIFAENAWVIIHADSYFYLPHSQRQLPDASLFPYPFVTSNETSLVEIVLPDDANEAEISAVLEIGRIIGQNSFGPIPEFVIHKQSNFEPGDGNYILIGNSVNNSSIALVDQENLEEWEGLINTTFGDQSVANIKLVASPWAEERYVLLIIGSPDGEYPIEVLNEALPSASIYALRDDGSVEAIRRDVPIPDSEAPVINPRPMLMPQPSTLQVVLGFLGITIFAIIVVVLIYQAKNILNSVSK